MFTLSSLATTVHFGDSASKIPNVTDDIAHDWSSSLLSVTVKQRTVYMTRAKSLYSVWVCWPVNFLFSSLRLVSPLSLPAAALPSMEMHFSFEKIDFWAPPAERKSFLPSITHVVKHERAMKVESSFRSLQILKSESAFLIIIRYIKVKCDFFLNAPLKKGTEITELRTASPSLCCVLRTGSHCPPLHPSALPVLLSGLGIGTQVSFPLLCRSSEEPRRISREQWKQWNK